MSQSGKSVFCVGLTGQIASGKTTVANYFKFKGIEVISADEINRNLTQADKPIFKKIATHFGQAILDEEGNLNRQQLRTIIMSKPKEKKWLESLLHPLIRKEIEQSVKSSQSIYSIIEIPLLTKKADYPYIKRVLCVQSSPKIQVKRLIQRDGYHLSEAEKMIKIQPKSDAYIKIADDLIINDGSLDELEKKVAYLHDQYLHMALNLPE